MIYKEAKTMNKINDILESNKIKSRGKYKSSVQHGVKVSGVTKNQFKRLGEQLRREGIKSAYALQKLKNKLAREKRRKTQIKKAKAKKKELISNFMRAARERQKSQIKKNIKKNTKKQKILSSADRAIEDRFIDFAADVVAYNLEMFEAQESGILPKLYNPIRLPVNPSTKTMENFIKNRKKRIELGVSGLIEKTWNNIKNNLDYVYGASAASEIWQIIKQIGMSDLEDFFNGKGVPVYWLFKSDIPNIDDDDQKMYVVDAITGEYRPNELYDAIIDYANSKRIKVKEMELF